MSEPKSYHLQRAPGAGTNLLSFTAGSDANAETVAQQVSTMLAIKVFLVATDSGALIGAGEYDPASQGSDLGNSVTGVAWSAY
jgi:hypothetical protein